MRRNFNDNERWILYRAANGHCQRCGKPLHGIFHADHIKPFAKGGATDVINGQVLCEECNMKKGDSFVEEIPEWTLNLRDWQQRALLRYMSKSANDFLLVATPGAGKTIFCLRVAHLLLTDGVIDQIAIVVPSENLKLQWANEAAQIGIELQTSYDASINLADDFHGIAATYQAVAARHETTKTYRHYVHRKRTLVIFDEIHHAGESLSWGKSVHHAFEHATKRLSVTGTPFRSDKHEIPFVEYKTLDGEQISAADFPYAYGDALRDGVVRPVYFQTYDGDMSWLSGDEIITATFKDDLGDGRSKERLRAAISTKGDWLHKVLEDAHSRLAEVRQSQSNAGGLVIAKDIAHAHQIKKRLEGEGERASICDTPVSIATSDNELGNDEINRFRESSNEWIVAVKMVSEGVDIKRLRVAVYATNVTTELFFRQAVGRIVRMIDGIEDQDAWFFIPRDPTIVGFAETFKEERNHVIDDDQEELLEEVTATAMDSDDSPSLFEVIRAIAQEDDVIHDATSFTKIELEEAQRIAVQLGLSHVNPVAVAIILRFAGYSQSSKEEAQEEKTPSPRRQPTLEEKKHAYRRQGGLIAKAIARLREASNGTLEYDRINRALNSAQNITHIDECTLSQLRQRIEVLNAWSKSYHDGTYRQFTPKGYLRELSGASSS